MSIRSLSRIFRPRQVAIVGASDEPGKVGYTVLRNIMAAGFAGPVYPVNARRSEVQGLPAFSDVTKLPGPVDLAIVCTPAASVPNIVVQCGQMGIRGLIVLSAGFRETGAEGRALEQQLREAQRQFPGLRILGPNCLGVISPGVRLNASFAAAMPANGSVAFLSQSGALCTAVLDWAMAGGFGFSQFVSLGNSLDVGLGDLLDYFANDPETKSAVLYVESISDARGFMSAARAFARHKPIVAYKAGRFAESAQAAASHTGAMAGVDAVYEAAFQRAGIVRVDEIDEIFDCAQLLAKQPPPSGSRLAIVTNAGGPGVMAADALLARDGVLARLSAATIARLSEFLPPSWSHGNPVDVLGDATASRYADALDVVLMDEGVDAALVILTPQAMTDATAVATRLSPLAKASSKPVLTTWMGSRHVEQGTRILNDAGIVTYTTPEKAVRAFLDLVGYGQRRELLYETPRELEVAVPARDPQAQERLRQILSRPNRETLGEELSKEVLELYGIPTTRPIFASTANDAVAAARQLGYPVVLKISSPDISHKTDVGGVVLNLSDESSVTAAFEDVVARSRQARPDARIDGVTVQAMMTAVHGVEMILGAKRDPTFGTVIMVGAGGITAELYADRSLELPPLNERLARRMLTTLRSWPLLAGYRGRKAANVERLVEILIRFSYLVAECPEIVELDVNPLLVTADWIVGLDARVVVEPYPLASAVRPFAHLAIRPYPDEYTQDVTLPCGTTMTLRAIKPEDEPMWHELVASCSAESLWSRFGYLFRTTTHDLATRFCFLDYDREIAVVAEHQEHGHRRLVGVGRLISDVEHRSAEYAVLVCDAWQGKGLGTLLSEHCMNVARQWKLKTVTAETGPLNKRMLDVFKRLGFQLDYATEPGTVFGVKSL